ncbi:ribonuclease E/G [Mesorhizobium sp. BR1-1-16]|uniref:Rne/Rng family ribonuclease n=1 Tax=Mesorhizobium sp. BR1-1-16 TaxID=2876653 RepID=UPI001CCD9E25|nr:ribonuclease E/G [Mesorhizobium sp. BR1-1-16]MBZ9935350.1 ribonuclease E/G [Mesorhizobium sp. BR1-1-16]
MANKMLIDATHPEETRVVVVRGSRVEEFDFESASRKQLRGNIYLAKVTRVEPSLQAAFVEYGGNRHGFLAFSEIHPDYYQIPVADRQALIDAEEQEEREADERAARQQSRRQQRGRPASARSESVSSEPTEGAEPHDGEHAATEGSSGEGHEHTAEAEAASETSLPPAGEASPDENDAPSSEDNGGDSFAHLEAPASDHSVEEIGHDEEEENPEDAVESVGAEDALEELPERRRARARQYKIQEVIKRRQVLLVQVVKEERGNKGAALTTYLSLAGRYSVLMPNTARGGGISRKITNTADRKRLKEVAQDLDVPEGMGVILRTAGASRTKAEVKRDFEYLLRLWENVRELTLRSAAPTLVYEEGSLIKRSIRDLYNKDIDEVLVAGDDGYREAKDFMRMLMPSHAKNVQPYRETQQIFARYGIETQLDAMFSPQVTLKSGGYLVINQTEALVAIDVNSGRSTREHNIEDTAYQTNLEAAEEVARQLRLRDLAGLIVIDFIDMEEKRNNRAVENKLKTALKNDRARIQVGRISHFGLMEMSRQRIRTGVVESSMEVCPHCHGTGHVRAPASVALHVLRSIEDTLIKGATHDLIIRTRTAVALYILNQKRGHLAEIESSFGISITVLADDTVTAATHYTVERGEPVVPRELPVRDARAIVQPDSIEPDDEVEIEEPVESEETESEGETEKPTGAQDDAGGRRKRRRRRRRRSGDAPRDGQADGAHDGEDDHEDGDEGEEAVASTASEPTEGDNDAEAGEAEGEGTDAENEAKRRRRRGRRGGRRGRRENGEGAAAEGEADANSETPSEDAAQSFEDDQPRLELDETGELQSTRFVEDEPEGIRDIDPEDAGERLIARDVPIADMAEYEAPLLDGIDEEPELDMPEVGDDEDDEPEDESSDLRVIDEDSIEEAEGPQEPDESVVPPDAPSDPVSDTAEEDTRPKRVGWWRRRS